MGSSVAFLRVCFLVFVLGSSREVHGQGNVFNVMDYGAIADGTTDNSKALLNAWSEACQMKGGGTVLIPNGTFMVNPVAFKGPCNDQTVFEVDGVVKAPIDASLGSQHWLFFDNINGLTLCGSGEFDGQGAPAWLQNNCKVAQDCKVFPVSIVFNSVTNASVHGITSLNSKYFHFAIFNSENINFNKIKISAPGNSPNTDGIHIGNSNYIKITDTNIATGDDCISIGAGSTNINITGVSCGPGHGISIGSLGKYQGEENVSGINVRNCTISDTQNGMRIKTWAPSQPSSVSDVTFEDITLINTNNPIIIDQQYCPYESCISKGDSHVQVSNVKFINIFGTSSSKIAVNLQCSPSVPCEGIELDDVNIRCNSEDEPTSSCSNAKVSFRGQQIPPPCT